MDEVYRQWFDASTVTVDVQMDNSEAFLTDLEIAELTGAPKNSTIIVKKTEKGISFEVANEIFESAMYRLLTVGETGVAISITNEGLELAVQYTGQGIGPRCVIKEIFAAKSLYEELRIEEILVHAYGNFASFDSYPYPMRGYYVWAMMGFDAEIPDGIRNALDKEYQHVTQVSDLMRDDKGREQWLNHGDTIWLTFDLKVNSVSWRLLERFMADRRIEL